MADTRPSFSDLSRLLSNYSGQRAWGIAWSIAGFTIELGRERVEPERGRRCGEIGIFILCSWFLKTATGEILSEQNGQHKEWTPILRTHLDSKTIKDIALDPNHKLVISFREGEELVVLPNPGQPEEEEWTVFYFTDDGQQHWCSLNGKEIRYDD